MDTLLKTVLYNKHIDLNANMVEFGGFSMPLYYTSITDEHLKVRNDIGMFDISHMGIIVVEGMDATKFLNYVLSANIKRNNKMQYALILNESGGVIDDLMVYPVDINKYMLVVNASNQYIDFDHLVSNKNNFKVEVSIKNKTDYGQIALQGPNSQNILSKLFNDLPKSFLDFGFYKYNNTPVLISRSGYSGEDGFEIYSTNLAINKLWDEFLNLNVTPIGLGARDTLRFEAGLPLYGNETSLTINPIEAGLGFAVDLTKDDFIGKGSLISYTKNPKRKLVGLKLLTKNIARNGYLVFKDDKEIGFITTGYLTPYLNEPLAMAMVDIENSKIGTELTIIIRNKPVKCIIINKRFYKFK